MIQSRMSTKVSFDIDSIELVNRSMSKPPLEKIGKGDWEYFIRFEVIINAEAKKSVHTITLSAKLKSNKDTFGEIAIACHFIIHNFSDVSITEKGKLTLLPQVIDLLNTVTVGTARGCFFSEFRGTFLQKASLPILHPEDFYVGSPG
jgi:hypothetical protein